MPGSLQGSVIQLEIIALLSSACISHMLWISSPTLRVRAIDNLSKNFFPNMLIVMALPIRLIWNLQMKPKQKLVIAGLFCFGWICIIISTIRVVQLGETPNGVPAPSWLALWATIEASIGML